MAEEYSQPDRFQFGHGAYFYEDCFDSNYHEREKRRLKGIVKGLKMAQDEGGFLGDMEYGQALRKMRRVQVRSVC